MLADLLLIGIFGGFYIVPLYALIQTRSQASHRSRIIAGNNILNALFMVVAAILAVAFLNAGLSIPQLLLTDNRPPVVKLAAYKVVPAEGGKQNRAALVTFVTGGDVSRFQRSTVPGKPDDGTRGMSAAGAFPGAAEKKKGPVVNVARGNSVTQVEVGGKN